VRLYGTQSRSGHDGEEENPAENRTLVLQAVVSNWTIEVHHTGQSKYLYLESSEESELAIDMAGCITNPYNYALENTGHPAPEKWRTRIQQNSKVTKKPQT